jgi:DNA-binding CsgD family transcriptional regulator
MDVTDEVHIVRIALAANDTHLADQTVLAARRRAQDNPDVATIGAVAAHTAGLRHQSPEDLARAVDLFDDGPRPLALASALEDLGRLAIARGDTPAGTAAFDRALSLWVGSGAEWDSARVRRRLRSLGIRRRLLTAPRPRQGWAALTDSEMKVVQLIAAGQTNREASEQLFISPHTVSSHLRRAFAKLDVNSRAELARLAADNERSDGQGNH